MKKVIGVLFLAGILCLLILLFFYPKRIHGENTLNNPSLISLPYDTQWNYRQHLNACGPYSAAAVLRIRNQKPVSPEEIIRSTPWRYRGYTLPFGITSVLQANGVPTNEFIVKGSNEEKIDWLHHQLAQQNPVILLGRKSGLLHYITLVGYREKQFFIYDSLEEAGEPGMTLDKNGMDAGNVSWTDSQLLTFWEEGGILGLYKNYVIVPESTPLPSTQ